MTISSPRLLVLLLIMAMTLPANSSEYEWEVYVSRKGENDQSCMSSGGDQCNLPCSTMEYVAENAVNGTRIVIMDSLQVTGLVKFQNVTNITITAALGTQIFCNSIGSSGFVFQVVNNLLIENLTINNCGVSLTDAARNAAVHFQHCQTVELQDLTITESRGTGVLFFNTHGVVSVKSVHFIRNGINNTMAESGGMVVKFTHPNCSSSELHNNYLIDNCYFANNTVYINDRDEKYGLGGGLGLFFHSTSCFNNVAIRDTTLVKNKGRWAGGLYIGFRHSAHNNTVKIVNLTAEGNKAYDRDENRGLGGGLGLFFHNTSCFNNVAIRDATLVKNKGRWGGGLYVGFRQSARNNTVRILNLTAEGNTAYYAGGGTDFGYNEGTVHGGELYTNKVFVQHSKIRQNEAAYGGGSAIYASHTPYKSEGGETVSFENCTWSENLAKFSPAVDLSPFVYDTLSDGYLLVPVFRNCMFVANAVTHTSRWGVNHTNVGAFIVTTFTVQLEGSIVFKGHTYTALHVISGIIQFKSGTDAQFLNNTGIRGGAIALYGFSSLNFQNGSRVMFKDNKASELGGAIYHHSFDQHDFVSTRSCFIQYTSPQEISKNLTVRFEGNEAAYGGKSIYSLSFYPCYYEQFPKSRLGSHSMCDIFRRIANFEFQDKQQCNSSLATAGSLFVFSGSQPLLAIPGKKIQVPLVVKDELNSTLCTVYRVSPSNIKTDRHYMTTNNTIRLYGHPEHNGTLTFYTLSSREVSFSVAVSLQQCPPGYFLKQEHISTDNNKVYICDCAAYNDEHEYPGILKCNNSLFQAYIKQGFWAGYKNHETPSPENLYTAPCPVGLCTNPSESQLDSSMYILLPPNTSSESLSNLICDKDRIGYLCGECRGELSVYYHSEKFQCGKADDCKLGVLFFILSELLPLVLFFTTVVVLDISFTSGYANGFIFFSQVLGPLSVDAKGAIHLPKTAYQLSMIYKIVYGLFNFEFLSVEKLSFCLWKRATILDMLAFKYVTTLFAFLLVLCLVAIMKCCNCRQLCKLRMKIRLTNSVIHGLAAFLVICYAQCTRVSFQILTPVTLVGKGGTSNETVTFFGGIPYFESQHLWYAVPACICLLTIVAIPPLLLFGYPLYLQVLSLCGVSDVLWWLPFSKLKPLLDTFQGCYKDHFRFFAGLYFMYRVAILAAYAFCTSINSYYVVAEVLIIGILGFHSVVQPYEKKCHNIIDSLLFANLALINGLTIYAYIHRGRKKLDLMISQRTALKFQLLLIYIPLACVVCYILSRIVKRVKKQLRVMRGRKKSENRSLNSDKIEDSSSDYFIDHEHLPYQELELSGLNNTSQELPVSNGTDQEY